MVDVADRIGRPANVKDDAFQEIVDYWLEGGDERLPCLELSSLGQAMVRWIADGDTDTPAAVFAALEPVISEELSMDQDRGVLSGFVGPCLMEGIDGELVEDDSQELRHRVVGLMGPSTQSYWSGTLGNRS
jgi:hypothetical protein